MYETFDDNLPESREFELGFYRGRGGSKTSILDEEDMTSMYEYYSNPAQEISLWCHGKFGSDEDQPESFQGQSRKRKNEDASTCSSSKRKAAREETEEIMEKLKQNHGDKYKPGQYILWANMIQVGTHHDYDNPQLVRCLEPARRSQKNILKSLMPWEKLQEL